MIHLVVNDQLAGPYPEEEVRRMLATGKAKPDQMAWREGMENWRPVSEILAADDAALPAGRGVQPGAGMGTPLETYELKRPASEGFFALLFLGGLVATGVLAAVLSNFRATEDAALVVGLAGAALSVIGPLAGYFIMRSFKVTVTVFEEGLEIKTRGRATSVAVSEIHELRLTESLGVRNGEGVDRRMTIAAGAGGKWTVESRIKLGERDPLLELYERVVLKCAEVFTMLAKEGREIRGKEWTFSGEGLTLRKSREVISLSQLDYVSEFDGNVAFHKTGEAEPFCAFEASGPNVHILKAIAIAYMRARNLTRAPSKSPGGLGRVLFTKRPINPKGAFQLVLFWIFVVIMSAIAGAILSEVVRTQLFGPFEGTGREGEIRWWIAFVISQAVTLVLMGVWAWRGLKCMLRCHELGIFRRTLFGEKEMRFDEMTAFSNTVTRSYHNGVYTGTTMQMVFESEARRAKINYSGTMRGTDEDLNRLNETVSAHVARHLMSEIRAGNKVRWGDATLGQDGLMPKKAKAEADRVPYKDIRCKMQEGYFYLWWKSEKKPDMTVGCGSRNFWPGLQIVQGAVE